MLPAMRMSIILPKPSSASEPPIIRRGTATLAQNQMNAISHRPVFCSVNGVTTKPSFSNFIKLHSSNILESFYYLNTVLCARHTLQFHVTVNIRECQMRKREF